MGRTNAMPNFIDHSGVVVTREIIAMVTSSEAIYFDVDGFSRCLISIVCSDTAPRRMGIIYEKLSFSGAMTVFAKRRQITEFIVQRYGLAFPSLFFPKTFVFTKQVRNWL